MAPPAPPTPCPSGCGYVVTWHATHCCHNCKRKAGSHGPLCKKRPPTAGNLPLVEADDMMPPEAALPPTADHPIEPPRPESAAPSQRSGPAITAAATAAEGSGWYPGKYLKMAHQNLTKRMAEVKAAKAKVSTSFPGGRCLHCALRSRAGAVWQRGPSRRAALRRAASSSCRLWAGGIARVAPTGSVSSTATSFAPALPRAPPRRGRRSLSCPSTTRPPTSSFSSTTTRPPTTTSRSAASSSHCRRSAAVCGPRRSCTRAKSSSK